MEPEISSCNISELWWCSFPRSGNPSDSQPYPFTSWFYCNVLYIGAALEDYPEPSTGPERNDTGSDRHALICPCNTSALQVIWLPLCFQVQFKVLVATVKSYMAQGLLLEVLPVSHSICLTGLIWKHWCTPGSIHKQHISFLSLKVQSPIPETK